MIKKLFIVIPLLLTLVVGSIFFFGPSTESQKLALQKLLTGDSYGASKLLQASDFLYQGYLMQSMGLYDKADAFFDLEAQRFEEAKLAKALNAALRHDSDELTTQLENVRCPLLEALLHYQNFEYHKALPLFQAYSEQVTREDALWFDSLLAHYFPASFVTYHKLHCMIEEGSFEEVRGNLGACIEDDTTFYLLGLSYLKESEDPSCLKLAQYYLGQIQLENCQLYDKKRLATPLQKLCFIPILEKWHQKEPLLQLATQVAQDSFKSGQFPTFERPSLFTQLLSEKILECFSLETDPERLIVLYNLLETAHLETREIKEMLASSLEDALLKSLTSDGEDLTVTRRLCKYLDTLRPSLATFLIHQGKLYWLRENQERKGTAILKLGYLFKENAEKRLALKDIEKFFQTLYVSAEGANLIHRLSRIFDALQEFEIHSKILYPKAEIGNYLADAEYLFNARNYLSSKTHAELVLKLDPENTDALRLYGLSCYHTGDYNQAIAILESIPSRDEYAEKALMLSLSKAAAQMEKELAHLDTLDEND